MKQEDKLLLLKDLSARLPYYPKCEMIDELRVINNKPNPSYIECLFQRHLEIFYFHNNFTIKPYLRSISSMTDEEMDMLFDILHIDKDGKDDDWIKINDVYGIKFFFPTGRWIENVAEAYDYLNSIHIDYRGLIPKGLAIAVTEENNPYEKFNS